MNVWRIPRVRLLCAERMKQEILGATNVLDVGAGGRKLGAHVISVDIFAKNDTEIAADVCDRLPFPDNVFDLVVCTSVLEHVVDERAALREILRVTKPGGRLWIEVPFMYHFHVSSPTDIHDFRRWTAEGVKRLLPECRTIEIGPNVGAGTALWLMCAETCALLFFRANHTSGYYFARWALCWLLRPLSWLDRFLVHADPHYRVSGGFYILAEKGRAG